MIRVCVCGGRDYQDKDRVYAVLGSLHKIRQDFKIIQGGAKGADMLAAQWAVEHGVPYETFEADWEKHNRAAGPIRNAEMLKSGIDMLVAFPGGSGTANMISICEKEGIKVYKIKADID